MLEIWKKVTERQKLMLLGLAMAGALALYLLLYAGGGSQVKGLNMTEQEQRLAALLSSMDGVGRVEVMIAGESAVAAFAQEMSEDGKMRSALICAEGAENLQIYLQLQQAVAAALNLPAEKIEIYPLKGE